MSKRRHQPGVGEDTHGTPLGQIEHDGLRRLVTTQVRHHAIGAGVGVAGDARLAIDHDVGAGGRFVAHTDSRPQGCDTGGTAQDAPTKAATRSAIITVGRWVFARGTRGMIDASAIHNPDRSQLRPRSSTTASPRGPIEHDPAAWT